MKVSKLNIAAAIALLFGSFALLAPSAEAAAAVGMCTPSWVCQAQGSTGCYTEIDMGGSGWTCTNHNCDNGFCETICTNGTDMYVGDCGGSCLSC